jgi:hypothetical protein
VKCGAQERFEARGVGVKVPLRRRPLAWALVEEIGQLGPEGKASETDEPGRWLSGVPKAPRSVLTRVSLVATICLSAGRGMLMTVSGGKSKDTEETVSRSIDLREVERKSE